MLLALAMPLRQALPEHLLLELATWPSKPHQTCDTCEHHRLGAHGVCPSPPCRRRSAS